MCLALPGEIVALMPGDMARVRFGESELTISVALIDAVAPGDYVLAHSGFAITKLDPEEAQATLNLWREVEAAAAQT